MSQYFGCSSEGQPFNYIWFHNILLSWSYSGNQPTNRKIIQHPSHKTVSTSPASSSLPLLFHILSEIIDFFQHPPRKTTSTSPEIRKWIRILPPANEISVGVLGESGPDVAVKIWQIGIFSNLSAHRWPPQATCSHFATGFGGKIEIVQIGTSTFGIEKPSFRKHYVTFGLSIRRGPFYSFLVFYIWQI